MSLYRIHFNWKEKDVTLSAQLLDMTHPYFISIKDIQLPPASPLIIDPTREEFEKTFGKANHLMIPFQFVNLIEEIDDKDRHLESDQTLFRIVDAAASGKD